MDLIKSTQVFILLAGLSVAATAVPAHPVKASYDFGLIPLGTSITTLPKWAKEDTGCNSPTNNYADCSFKDSEGILYIVFEGAIVAKRYEANSASMSGPYGVRVQDNMEAAIKKVEKRLGIAISCYQGSSGHTCDGHLTDKRVGTIDVNLLFDNHEALAELTISSRDLWTN